MIGGLSLISPPSWLIHRPHGRKLLRPQCALTKQSHRFLTSLATAAATADEDSSAANRLIRKFVSSSGKSTALDALSHLLSPTTAHSQLSFFALPLYSKITEATWFNWNAKLVAELIALLEMQRRFEEAQTLLSETISKLGIRERDVASFYCNLIDSQSKHKLKERVFDSYAQLTQFLSISSSVYLKRRKYETIVNALCVMDLPEEAEKMVEEMMKSGLKPSIFETRSVVYAYGRLGLFTDMHRSIASMENQGFAVDTVCSNMILSSYGSFNNLTDMISWLQKMKTSQIPFSIRTYNSVLNSCPTIMSLIQDPKIIPLSIQQLQIILPENESSVIQQLVGSSVLDEAMEWTDSEVKLDLHGMHLGTAYLIVLQWMEKMKLKFSDSGEKTVVPAVITVVCGSGKHSNVRGESPVKDLVKEMMVRSGSVMRIDRKNVGCFVAKGQSVKNWLC